MGKYHIIAQALGNFPTSICLRSEMLYIQNIKKNWWNHNSLKIFLKIFGPAKIYGVNIHQKSLKIFSKIFSEKKIWRNHKSLKIFLKIFGPLKIYGVNLH